MLVAFLLSLAAHDPNAVARPPPPVEQRTLEVKKGVELLGKITSEELDKLKPVHTQASGGKAKQFAVRDAVSAIAGPTARVVGVELIDGRRVVFDAKELQNPERIFVVWQNRRGLFKVGFVDKQGQTLKDTLELRDLRALIVVL